MTCIKANKVYECVSADPGVIFRVGFFCLRLLNSELVSMVGAIYLSEAVLRL